MSSYSNPSGNCVEVWRTSSRSSATNCCVEVSTMAEVRVRDSKNRDEGILTFPAGEWTAFLDAVRADEF